MWRKENGYGYRMKSRSLKVRMRNLRFTFFYIVMNVWILSLLFKVEEYRGEQEGGDSSGMEVLRKSYAFCRSYRTSANGLLLPDAGTARGCIRKGADGRTVFY